MICLDAMFNNFNAKNSVNKDAIELVIFNCFDFRGKISNFEMKSIDFKWNKAEKQTKSSSISICFVLRIPNILEPYSQGVLNHLSP